MEWIKVKDQFPPEKRYILFFHNEKILMGSITTINNKNEFYSIGYHGYQCPNESCNDWQYDDCCCPVLFNDEHFWMPLPYKPNINP